MPLQPQGAAPYTSAAAAITAIEAFRNRGFGKPPVTHETLIRAGVPESIARRTLLSLKQLELLDANGEPSEQFERLKIARGEEEYRARLEEWLRGVYADVLQYGDPSTHSAQRLANTAFQGYSPHGQRMSMAALLIGLWKYAGLPVIEGETVARTPVQRQPTVRKPTGRTPRAITTTTVVPHGEPGIEDLPPGLVGLLRHIPRSGETWTTARRDAFIKAFEGVLDFSVAVDDDPPAAAPVGDDEEASA